MIYPCNGKDCTKRQIFVQDAYQIKKITIQSYILYLISYVGTKGKLHNTVAKTQNTKHMHYNIDCVVYVAEYQAK